MSDIYFDNGLPFFEPVKNAERLIELEFPIPALSELRRFAELFGRELARRHTLEAIGQLQDIEKLLIGRGILDSELGNLFRRIRLDGNDAVHEGKGDILIAKRNLGRATRLSRWFAERYEPTTQTTTDDETGAHHRETAPRSEVLDKFSLQTSAPPHPSTAAGATLIPKFVENDGKREEPAQSGATTARSNWRPISPPEDLQPRNQRKREVSALAKIRSRAALVVSGAAVFAALVLGYLFSEQFQVRLPASKPPSVSADRVVYSQWQSGCAAGCYAQLDSNLISGQLFARLIIGNRPVSQAKYLRLVTGPSLKNLKYDTAFIDRGASAPKAVAKVSSQLPCDNSCTAVFDFDVDQEFLSTMMSGENILFSYGKSTENLLKFPLTAFSTAAAIWKPTEGFPWDIKRKESVLRSWHEVVGTNFQNESWIFNLEGTAPPMTTINIDGKQYFFGSVCKPHDCADNDLAFLITVDGTRATGILTRWSRCSRVGYTLFGSPNAVERAKIEGLLAANRNRLPCPR